MTKCTISFEQFKEISNPLILLPFFDEISNNNLGSFRKELPHKFLDILICDFIRYTEHLEARTYTTMNEELKFDYLEPFHFIEIKDIE